MIVRDVLKNAITYLGLSDLLSTTTFSGSLTPTEQQEIEINTLVACCNLVVNEVASEYITLKNSVNLTSNTGIIYYSQISDKVIVDILKVIKNGVELKFECLPDKLKTESGNLIVEFAYQPNLNMTISSTIDFNNFKLNERVLAYGVVAEYCFINGRYDDAAIWDNRFKTSLNNINRPRREVKIKQRLWI